jgi:PAS domain S-box-containing protein
MTDWRYIPYALLLLGATALLVLFAFRAWRRRGTPGATALVMLMMAGAVWGVAYALSLGSADPSMRLFWGEVRYLGIVAVPLAWLVFALQYTGREGWVTRRALALLAIEPLVTLVLVFTSEAHGLFWSSREPSTTGPFPIVRAVYGPWFWVHLSYSYLLLLIGTVFLAQALVSSAHLYRGQRIVLVVGASVPWVGNALNISGLVPADSPDPAPFAFAVTGVAFVWALSRYGVLDVASVARDAVVEGMGDGVIVLDVRDRVVDLNPAAQRILGCPVSEAVGCPVARVMPGQVTLLERHCGSEGAHGEATLGNGSGPRDYDLAISSLWTRSGVRAGRLISLRDITARKRTERTLRESEERFRTVIQSLGEGLLITDVDDIVLYTNPRMTELTGYAEEEMLGRPFYELLLPREQWPEMVRRSERRARRAVDRYEIRLKRKDGGRFGPR